MNDRKEKVDFGGLTPFTGETGDRQNLSEEEMLWKVEALDAIFNESKNHPEEFHMLYVQPLLDAELNLETALELLVAGAFRPN